MKECVKRLWNTLKTTFLNIKLQRLYKSHHLQCITLSKDSEKLERSLCLRDKAEDLCWMPVVFGPSDDTASLIDMILSLTLINGPRNTSRNHCLKHNQPYHLQMPTKALSCKEEAICEHGPEHGQMLIKNWLYQSKKVFYDQTSPNMIFLLEIMDTVSSGLKKREISQRVISIQFKSQHL